MSSGRLVSIVCDNCVGIFSVRMMRRGPLSVAAYWAGAEAMVVERGGLLGGC